MKKFLFYLFLFVIILGVAFRSLLLNLSTNLVDWRDYAYVTWIINQNINHLKLLDFSNLFNTNAFYPYTQTLFLSDTLLTPSIIGVVFSFFTNNPVLNFNLVFISTFILNYVSAYLVWKKIFKNSLISFIGSLAIVFSTFFYIEIGHFQMQNYWPFFLAIFFLIDTDTQKSKLKPFLVGLFLAIQFLASIYLAFFLATTILVFLLINLLKNRDLKTVFLKGAIIFIIFILLDGIFIKGYLDARKNFDIKRDYGEYVTYSSHITDYLFPHDNGLFYQNQIIKRWSNFNKHATKAFPGVVLTITALLGLLKFKNSKGEFSISFAKDQNNYLFLCLILIGFAFSLGPRINFNGIYGTIPLPYTLLLKYVPLFDTIRGLSRWSFLLYFGLTYFSLLFLNRISKKWVLGIIIAIFFLEFFPINFVTYKDSYLTKNDEILKEICSKEKTAILEIPVTHFDGTGGLLGGLTYITKKELASLYNHCYLINGYSGYDLPSIQKIKDDIYKSLEEGKVQPFLQVLKQSGASLVVINKDNLDSKVWKDFELILSKLEKTNQITHFGEGVYKLK